MSIWKKLFGTKEQSLAGDTDSGAHRLNQSGSVLDRVRQADKSSLSSTPLRSSQVQTPKPNLQARPVTICATFDTDKAGSSYGRAAWLAFWKVIRERDLGVGARLYCGDLLSSGGILYGISVESTNPEVIEDIRSRLAGSEDYQKISGTKGIIDGITAASAHLIDAGTIDSRHVLVGGESDWARVALSSVKLPELTKLYVKDAINATAAQPRERSQRTNGMQSVKSMAELKDVLKSRFPTERDISALLPGEVCDLADACMTDFYIRWELSGAVFAESFVKIYFMERSGAQEACQFYGFFSFPSAGDIDRLIREAIGVSRTLLNIKGITALSLIGPKEARFNENGKAWMAKESLSGDELWQYTCLRRVQLGLVPESSASSVTGDYQIFKVSGSGMADLLRITDEDASRLTPSEAVEILQGASRPQSFEATISMRDLGLARELLKEKPDLATKRDSNGDTQLHLVAQLGYAEMAQLLIESGADVGARNSRGVTPLHFAAFDGHKALIDVLLAKGAEVNARNNDGRTPMWYVQVGCCDETIVDLLRLHGAIE